MTCVKPGGGGPAIDAAPAGDSGGANVDAAAVDAMPVDAMPVDAMSVDAI